MHAVDEISVHRRRRRKLLLSMVSYGLGLLLLGFKIVILAFVKLLLLLLLIIVAWTLRKVQLQSLLSACHFILQFGKVIGSNVTVY